MKIIECLNRNFKFIININKLWLIAGGSMAALTAIAHKITGFLTYPVTLPVWAIILMFLSLVFACLVTDFIRKRRAFKQIFVPGDRVALKNIEYARIYIVVRYDFFSLAVCCLNPDKPDEPYSRIQQQLLRKA